jgi:hypothetical protein
VEPNDVGKYEGRSGKPDRPLFDPLHPENVDLQLDLARKKSKYRRIERWENFRSFLSMGALTLGAIGFVVAFAMSCFTLLFSSDHWHVEVASRTFETLIGGLIAGLIGLWAVKSFER